MYLQTKKRTNLSKFPNSFILKYYIVRFAHLTSLRYIGKILEKYSWPPPLSKSWIHYWYPILTWLGVPHFDLTRGVPQSWPGVPHPALSGGDTPVIGYPLPGTGVRKQKITELANAIDLDLILKKH